MAYRKYNNNRKKTKSKVKYSKAEKLAYNLGRIAKSLKNQNSLVYDSYKNGLNGKTTANKKPLF